MLFFAFWICTFEPTNKNLQTMENYFYYLFIGLTFIFLCLSLETIIKDFRETIDTIKNNLRK